MQGNLTIDPATSALLVMDYQNDIVANYVGSGDGLLERAGALLARARAAGVRIVYVKVGFRPGYPEVSPHNLRFSTIKASNFLSGAGGEIHSAVAPREGEITVVKHRVSAFMGTDLEMILRVHGIETLILCGIATSGVVLSTVRYAADADYRIVVVADCCTDRNAGVHQCLVESVFPGQATVVNAADLLAALPA